MHTNGRSLNAMFHSKLQLERGVLAVTIMLLLLSFIFLFVFITAQPAQGQTYSVIYNFTGGQDGAGPSAGLTMDSAGNLYGTTLGSLYNGHQNCISPPPSDCGTVFKLTPSGSGWFLTTLHSFTGPDGANPAARLYFGADGGLYGTTGGGSNNDGTVFELTLSPHTPPTVFGGWRHTVLHSFTGSDGADPWLSPVTFDAAGNIYMTTWGGGLWNHGTADKLTQNQGAWSESVIHDFGSGLPVSGLILDSLGDLYGTDLREGLSYGVVFELTPTANGWTENILYNFSGGGNAFPGGGLIFDQAGNLYGTTAGDYFTGGTVFELLPNSSGWQYSLLHAFSSRLFSYTGLPGGGPMASLAIDAAGRLYGTTSASGQFSCGSGFGCGSIFELAPGDNGWTFTTLHDFTGGADGAIPVSSITFGTHGELYGTANSGGAFGYGVVWEITP